MMFSGGDHGKRPYDRSPTTLAASRRPIEQGWMPPPVGDHHLSGGSLLYVSACLGFLLCHDTSLCLLIGVRLYLLQMQWLHRRWSSSCKSSSSPQERELDSKEGTLMAWEDGLVASECTVGRVQMECDIECDQAEAIR
jgi:hypothetical protein